MDTIRTSAKHQNNKNFDELQDSSEDENNRVRGDQMSLKRKAFSYAGLPVLAQQRFSSIKKQNHAAQSTLNSKEIKEQNTVRKLIRRRHTADFTRVMENMSAAAPGKNTAAFEIVHEEDQFVE